MVDSTLHKPGPENGESDSFVHEKQPPDTPKKIPLRDLQNEKNIAEQKPSGTHASCKEEIVATEGVKVSGTKRPPSDSPINPSHNSSLGSSANGHLVYVRRKLETEVGKNNNNEIVSHKADDHQPRLPHSQEDANQRKVEAVEAREHASPALAPIPSASTMAIPSEELTASPNLVTSNNVSTVPSSDQKRMINRNWEERYLQLQMYLKKLDQINLDDHLRALRSFSAAELSRYAVDLEKRAIHLSLEEGKELQRVRALNVLGKSVRNFKPSPAIPQDLAWK